MKNMNPQQIRDRLAQITDAQAEHDARDFDAELADVMQAGGDLDAIEGAQFEAQRQARRLRVERQALEAALPTALANDARATIVKLQARAKDHPDRLRKITDAVLTACQALQTAESDLRELETERRGIWDQAEAACRTAGLDVSLCAPLAKIRSQRLADAALAAGKPIHHLPILTIMLNGIGTYIDQATYID